MVKTAIKCLIWFLGSQFDVVSRSLSTNETVREGEAGTGEKSQDGKLQSQSAGGELSIGRQQLFYFVEMFFLKIKYLCVRRSRVFHLCPTWSRVLIFLLRFCKVCLFSRLFNADLLALFRTRRRLSNEATKHNYQWWATICAEWTKN